MKERIRSSYDGGYKASQLGALTGERGPQKDIPPRHSQPRWKNKPENGLDRVLAYFLSYPNDKAKDAALALGLSIHTIYDVRSRLIQDGKLEPK